MKLASALVLLFAGCASAHGSAGETDLESPVDMHRGASTILIHRPMPLGTSLHVQGVVRAHRRTTALTNGFVAHQDSEHLQLVYDVTKTLAEVDLGGYPKRVRYAVGFIETTDADLPPMAAMAEGRVVRMNVPGSGQVYQSGGQLFDFQRVSGEYRVEMLSGALANVEKRALTDPLGPGYELWFEGELARLFGAKEPQREGSEWDVDPERARQLLIRIGKLEEPITLTGKVTFVSKEKVGDVPVQRIEAWIRGDGGVPHEITHAVHANTKRAEIKYTGLFPVDLGLPPVEHSWKVTAKGHLIVEYADALRDIQFQESFEHDSRILQVRR